MITFRRLVEVMEMGSHSPLMDSGDESKKLSVIRAGQAVRGDNDNSFWEDFVSLCGNAEGMGELLGVGPERVRSWTMRIREAIQSVAKHDRQGENKPETRREMLPTGDNGAVTTSTIGRFNQGGKF